MSHQYLKSYQPAMPAVEIWLGYPEESLSMGPLVAIIDSGADSTIVPQDLLDQLGAPFSDTARLRSHWGEWREISLFTVDIGLDNLHLPAMEVVGDEEGDEIILGRNVLNRLKLLLDGPLGQVKIMSR